jgi:DNA-binding MarR family transcriptional regulator
MSRKPGLPLAASSRHFSAGVRVIERALSPSGGAVIGLHLYMAYGWLVRSMSRRGRFGGIKPAVIGVPAVLNEHPGLSQTEVADMLGLERMTVGVQVKHCISSGLVKRQRSDDDRRKYRLYVTAKGRDRLRRIAKLIPQHEAYLFGELSKNEQKTLHRLLRKVIDGSRRG